ncbi:uncharacterized protein LOC133176759 [Saccostrea echinata]|uniref:uncharacterized protein LOC133176759 n=1 Tax=Saccostrea echinata TaxID=191078 RepID=UPI002A7F0686|nr:uncharacterized protein LOC133176759 [Saccostrea echinata]
MGSFDKPEEWAGTFPVNEILEKILKSPDPKCCDSCLRDNEEEDASDFCLSCLEFLCKMCTKYHKKHLLSRSHNTCPLNKIKSQHIQLAFGKDDVCKKHQDQKLKLFCYKHEQTCCIICGGTEHRKCDSVETVEKAAQNYKESGEIDSILADVKSFRQKLIDAKDKQERNITELEDTFDKMSDETEKEINDIVRLIERLKREQLDEFSAAIKEGKEKLIRNVITFNDGIQCAEFCSNKLEKSIEIKDESIFMTKFNAAKETFQHLKNIRFRTTGVRVTAIKKSIVKEIAQMKKLASIEVTELVQDIPSVIFDVKNVQLELITEFSSSERKEDFYLASGSIIVKTDNIGNRIKYFNVPGSSAFNIHTTKSGLIVYTDYKIDKVCAIDEQLDSVWNYMNPELKCPYGLDSDSLENIYVAGMHSHNIHVVSSVDDREISSEPNVEEIVDNDENIKDTWSIALLPDLPESQRIIVCNDQSVVLYQKQRDRDWSNKELKRINGNSFIRCIATFNSRILYSATNCKKVYETDEQFSTEATRPFFTSKADGWTPRGIAFSLLNPGNVWIGLYHAQTKKGKVIKVQSEGKIVGYLGDEGDRKPYTNPRFLAENRNGDICIADGVSKKVFALSPNGNVCFSYKPSGIISGYGARTVATDKKCNILVAYPNDGIHVLNSIGKCLLILKEMAYPTACCVSLKDSLFVCSKDGDIKEITYLMPPSPTNQ